ncbi:RagB/SusD family nutrient uptake outer membrane protein [Gemmatimonas sp.]|uniref:RagB/SusD family nutrient uptake outer membrane protein n=1 Tax=Gemmatimonas sp. TaxID=1962908 RepID=UPI0035697748
MHTPHSPVSRPVAGRRRAAVLIAAIAAASLVGCVDLAVTDPNNLSIATVFNNAANTEAALIGSWKAYTAVNRGSCPTVIYSLWGHDITTTSVTWLEFAPEPRLPINNRDNVNCATRVSFWTPYEASAGAREAFIGIRDNALKFGTINAATPDGADTPNRKLFAKFIIAISQLKLALATDQAYITDSITPGLNQTNVEFRPWPEVLDNAKAQMRVVIAEARATPNFTWPALFINGRPITRDELVRVMYAFLVRADVYSPRTPAQRNAVNWGAVLARLDSGITRDFGWQADPAVANTGSTYINNSFAQNTIRIHNRLLGPGDTSGNYQAWVAASIANRTAFIITSPDRRIHGAANNLAAGTRFTRQTATMGSASNGAYLTSWYRSTRYLNTAADSGIRAFIQVISLDEMKFIRAEALFRLGRFTEAAALINPTRVAAGLRPVDANGPPAGRDCVPRKDSGACGDLFDAIQYEKRIELYPTEGDISWWDARGWGKLVPGTPFHVPVSGRELLSRGLPIYTFGGVGSPGTAP